MANVGGSLVVGASVVPTADKRGQDTEPLLTPPPSRPDRTLTSELTEPRCNARRLEQIRLRYADGDGMDV